MKIRCRLFAEPNGDMTEFEYLQTKKRMAAVSTSCRSGGGGDDDVDDDDDGHERQMPLVSRGRNAKKDCSSTNNNWKSSDEPDDVYKYQRRRSRAVLYQLSGSYGNRKSAKSKLQLSKVSRPSVRIMGFVPTSKCPHSGCPLTVNQFFCLLSEYCLAYFLRLPEETKTSNNFHLVIDSVQRLLEESLCDHRVSRKLDCRCRAAVAFGSALCLRV